LAVKKLFLCHPRSAAHEVHILAEALRLRGIVPWVDQQGGFRLGDAQIDTARRAIREDCFGLLLYATADAFDSSFIRRVEMAEALIAHDHNADFLLLALPRSMDFRELARISLAAYGFDLSGFASRSPTAAGENAEWPVLEPLFAVVAREWLPKALMQNAQTLGRLHFQFSTRDKLADEPGDVLCLDATGLFGQPSAVTDPEAWKRVHQGLRDVKESISQTFGRARLRVHGSKHLTAAFLLGYTFPSTSFELDIRVKQGFWATDSHPAIGLPIATHLRGGSADSNVLHVEVNTLNHGVTAAVRRYVMRTGNSPFESLRLTVSPAAYGGAMDNATAVAIAQRVRQEVARVVSQQPVEEIHLFAAVPQALATMIGQLLNALPPVQLYEYHGQEYHPSYRLN
jgi:hypothetical protein